MTRLDQASDRTAIPASELRDALAAGEKLTVLDIRPRHDHEAWHVPGSENDEGSETG